MMPFQEVNPPNITPPAISRPAEDLAGSSISQRPNSTLSQVKQRFREEGENAANQLRAECQISNRPANSQYKVVYVNGIRTSEVDARRSAGLVRGSLGLSDAECTIVYNPKEHPFKSGLKIIGGTLSARLGEKSESQCVHELHEMIADTLYSPHSRLTVVGHSQGSLVIQNAFDKAFDDFRRFPETRRIWDEAAPRIEVIMYAPLVRTLAPGPQAVALLNGFDLPARGLGVAQRAVAASKHYLGYREQQAVRTVVYHPETNEFRELLFNPKLVHESFQLIMDNPEFNFRLFAENPKTRKPDAKLFCDNLHASVREGRRGDLLHFELIRMGCETFGSEFVHPFIEKCRLQPGGDALCIDNFTIDGPRLHYVRAFAK